MKKCPKCNRYMNWYCKYRNGEPYCGWHCLCGFDTDPMYDTTIKGEQGEQERRVENDA